MRSIAVRQGEAISLTNPVLWFANISRADDYEGFLRDVEALDFQIWDMRVRSAPAQVFPALAGTWQAVDLDAHRLGEGRYVAVWTVGALQAAGQYEVRWRVQETLDDDARQLVVPFAIALSSSFIPDAYATIEDMRAEGVPVTAVFTDARVAQALEAASALVEEYTGRVFHARFLDMMLDGKGGPILQLDEPIIGVEEIAYTFQSFTTLDLPLQEGDIVIYNRHIRDGLREPDDREDPRIEFLRVRGIDRVPLDYGALDGSPGFTQSQQNVRVTGIFGYTEPTNAGHPVGVTPAAIREVTMRLAFQKLRPLFSTFGTSSGPSGPVTSERTMDQSITYASPTQTQLYGGITGDPTIDQILLNYSRPAYMGSA